MKIDELVFYSRNNILKVPCDLLSVSVTAEVSMQSSNGYVVDWTKLYPILVEYESTVNCKQYHRVFTEMIRKIKQWEKQDLKLIE